MESLFNTSKNKNLIFDIGLHKGEDTEFYLLKGFDVVAFEASPELASACSEKFREYIDSKQLTIIEGAIIEPADIAKGMDTVSFYVNDDISVWGTVNKEWSDRNERLGTTSRKITVDAVNLIDVIKRVGVPHFMKIDIEGSDLICIESLQFFKEKPDYISIESDKTSISNISKEIGLLVSLGYDGFKAVEQYTIPNIQVPPIKPLEGVYVKHSFKEGSSGLFGAELPGSWKSSKKIINQYRMIHIAYYLLGDDGVMTNWKFIGAWIPRLIARSILGLFTRSSFPCWYDTHASYSEKN